MATVEVREMPAWQYSPTVTPSSASPARCRAAARISSSWPGSRSMIGKWSIGTGSPGGLVSPRRSTRRCAPAATIAMARPESASSR